MMNSREMPNKCKPEFTGFVGIALTHVVENVFLSFFLHQWAFYTVAHHQLFKQTINNTHMLAWHLACLLDFTYW